MDCGELGFKEDKKGCALCECNEPPAPTPEPERPPEDRCPGTLCTIHCPHGRQRDYKGCEICKCRRTPLTQLFKADEHCPIQECKMFCENGYEEDSNQCPICECKEPDHCLGRVMCALFCDYGFLRGEDSCPICVCAEDPCNVSSLYGGIK